MLKLGLESGDQGVLDALEKGIRIDEASRALKALKGAGIGTYVYLLFGPRRKARDGPAHPGVYGRTRRGDRFSQPAIFNLPAGSDEAASLRVHPSPKGSFSLRRFRPPRGVGQAGGEGLSGQGVPPAPRRFAHREAPTAAFHIQPCPVFAKFLLKISAKDYKVWAALPILKSYLL